VLERELGRGGMATVYLAHDLKHDRPVALKVLRPELAATLGLERFLLEIRVTARLQHPHILPLLDSGMIETAPGATSPFYTMPYVEGESLRSRLRRERQLSLDEALRLAGDVASALAYAHGRGVVHRDVKPENILLSNGQAVVADFGIARAVSLAGGDRLTSTGLALGTPHYMSPEQTAGDPEVDARADVCPGRRRPVADRAGAAGPALSAERLRGGRSGHRACAGCLEHQPTHQAAIQRGAAVAGRSRSRPAQTIPR